MRTISRAEVALLSSDPELLPLPARAPNDDHTTRHHQQDTRTQTTGQRFVAGAAFFNYNDFGSLRPGQEAIQLCSVRYIGLAIHVALCGFAFHFFSYGYGRLLGEYLKANNDEQQVKAANYMLVWPQALAIFIGLCSDALPMGGYRRKSYMVLGWTLCCGVCITIIILDVFGKSGATLFASASKNQLLSNTTISTRSSTINGEPASAFPYVYLAISLLGATGIQIAWISAVVASVEYAQREHVYHRGRLQATLVSLYYFGGVVAKIVTASIITESASSENWDCTISLGQAAMVLAGVSLFAIPWVVVCLDEAPTTHKSSVLAVSTPQPQLSVVQGSRMALGQRLAHFWRFCHQNIVYRVLFFIGLHLFLLGMYNQNVRDAVQQWCKVSRHDALLVEIGRMSAQVIGTLVWKYLLRNVGWRTLAFWGPALYIVAYVALTMSAAHDLVRNKYVYATVLSLADIPRAWIVLFALVLGTEIAEIGHEGVAVALGLSFQALAALADYTLAAIYPKVLGFEVTKEEVAADSDTTRRNVVIALWITVAFNVASFALIRLPPRQKLDAQQMKAFGGYNRLAGSAVVVTFVVFLSFNLAVNLMVVL